MCKNFKLNFNGHVLQQLQRQRSIKPSVKMSYDFTLKKKQRKGNTFGLNKTALNHSAVLFLTKPFNTT